MKDFIIKECKQAIKWYFNPFDQSLKPLMGTYLVVFIISFIVFCLCELWLI